LQLIPAWLASLACVVSAQSCGEEYLAAQGSLWSPKYNSKWADPTAGYPSNSKCVWTIKTTPGRYMRFGFFNTFDIEESRSCTMDYVAIYNGIEVAEKQLIGRFCGIFPPPVLSSLGDSMTVEFRTDSSGSGNGFLFSWQTYEFDSYQNNLNNGICGGTIKPMSSFPKSHSGYIESPGYPKQPYNNNTYCMWKFDLSELPYFQGLDLTVDNMEIEDATSCNYDQVSIYNSTDLDVYEYTKTDLIRRFCGPSDKEKFSVLGDYVYITFGSDGGNTAKGFRIKYELIPGLYDLRYLEKYGRPKKVWKPRQRPTKTPQIVAVKPVVEPEITQPKIISPPKKPERKVVVTQPVTEAPPKKEVRKETKPPKITKAMQCPTTCTKLEDTNLCDFIQFFIVDVKRIKNLDKKRGAKKGAKARGHIYGKVISYRVDNAFVSRLSKKLLKKYRKGAKVKVEVDCFKCLKKKQPAVVMLNRIKKGSLVKGFVLEETEKMSPVTSADEFTGQLSRTCDNFA